MRTYIVYDRVFEVFRGCLPDCCNYISDTYTRSNVTELTICIMLPENVKFNSLSKIHKKEIMRKLALPDRISLRPILISRYGK